MKVVFVCISLILVLVIIYSGLRILESTIFYNQNEDFEIRTKTITRDGVKYFPRQDINVILLMGINQEGPAHAEEPNHDNAADMVALAVIDEKTESWSILNLNRDSMVDMPMLDTAGKEIDVGYAQLSYAHTFGTGMEDSCENTRKTVSNLLGGVNIDYYISINIEAIAMLNDAVGGVTVNVEDDFSAVDPSIPKGTVTLMGNQARSFVQSRWYVGDQLNLSRIERQKQYMDGFVDSFKNTMQTSDTGFVLNTYNEVAPYLVSDLPVSTLTGMVERYMDYPLTAVYSLEGENKLEDNYHKFYIDEDHLEDLRLELFYAPK
jgi:LCP family protein required for cell wall assembly